MSACSICVLFVSFACLWQVDTAKLTEAFKVSFAHQVLYVRTSEFGEESDIIWTIGCCLKPVCTIQMKTQIIIRHHQGAGGWCTPVTVSYLINNGTRTDGHAQRRTTATYLHTISHSTTRSTVLLAYTLGRFSYRPVPAL